MISRSAAAIPVAPRLSGFVYAIRNIVAEARNRGYSRLSLETGSTEPFAAALRLYESEGFVPCGPFGDYRDTPFTRFFTREL